MNFQKSLIISAFISLCSVVGLAEKNTVVVNLTSGDNTQIFLDDDIEATFTDDDMVFQSKRVNVAIARETIKNFEFINTQVDGVKDITHKLCIDVWSTGINIYNLSENSTVRIYDINGVELFSTTTGGDVSIPGNRLAKGVNIVRVNNDIYKISFK